MNLPNNQTTVLKSSSFEPATKGAGFVGTIDLLGPDGSAVRSWKVRQSVCTIGAGSESHIQIDGEGIAGVHLSLSFGRRHVAAKSQSGFWVSGRAVREWLFDSATELQFGSRTIRITPARVLNANSKTPSTQPAPFQHNPIPLPTSQVETTPPARNENERAKTLSIVSDSVSAILPTVEKVVQDLVGPLRGAMEEIRSSVQEVVDRSQQSREIEDRREAIPSQELLQQLEANLADRIEDRFASLLAEIERIRELSPPFQSSPTPSATAQSELLPVAAKTPIADLPPQVDPFLLQELESSKQRLQEFESQIQRLREERDLAQTRSVELSTELVQISQSAQNDQRMARSVSEEHQKLLDHLSSLDNELVQVQQVAQQDANRWESSVSAMQEELAYWQEKATQLQEEVERSHQSSQLPFRTSASQELDPFTNDGTARALPTQQPLSYEETVQNQSYEIQDDPYRSSEVDYGSFQAHDPQSEYDIEDAADELVEPSSPYLNEGRREPHRGSDGPSYFANPEAESEYREPYRNDSTQEEEEDSSNPFDRFVNDPDAGDEVDSDYQQQQYAPQSYDDRSHNEQAYEQSGPLNHYGMETEEVEESSAFEDRYELAEEEDSKSDESLFGRFRAEEEERDQRASRSEFDHRNDRDRHSIDAPVDGNSISDAIIASLRKEVDASDREIDQKFEQDFNEEEKDDYSTIRRIREVGSELLEEKYEPQPLEDLNFDALPASQSRKQVESEEDEDSIEAYMKQLLQRVRGTTEIDSTTSKNTGGPKATSTGAPRTRITEEARSPKTEVEGSSRESNRDSISHSAERSIPQDSKPFDPANYTPRQQAPERSQNMAAMRDLANVTARRAIEKSDRRRLATQGLFKLSVAAIGLAGALFLLMINGFRMNMALVGTVAGLCIACLWGWESIALLSNLAKTPVRSAPVAEDNPLVPKANQQ